MSFSYIPNLQDVKKESLQTQLDYLNLLRLRHLQWKKSANDPGTQDVHSQIIEQIEGITDQYSGLLNKLRP